MFLLCLLVVITALALTGVRWETGHRAMLGMTGALCVALGVRVVTLAAAMSGSPFATPSAWGDEPRVELPVAGAVVEDTSPPDRPAPESETPVGPGPLAESPGDELTRGGEDELAGGYVRQPVKSVAKAVYLASHRPGWIETPPTYDGSDLKVAVLGGPFVSLRDCERQLAEEVERTVAEFVDQQVGAPAAHQFIRFSLDQLRRRNVVRQQFQEQLETSMGLMNQVHAQLVFDDDFRKEIDQRWGEIRSRGRLVQTGLGAGVVLLLLGTMFSYFKLDTATRGYYTGRLQFAAAGTILALVAASVLLARWVPWM